MSLILSCKLTNEKAKKIESYDLHCIEDTILKKGTFINYFPKIEDSICLLTLSIKGIVKNNIDSFYIDKNDCRMVPKVVHFNDSCLFLITGSGFTFRMLYIYHLTGEDIFQSKFQFDNLESDINYSYYPYIINESLFVLKIDSAQKVIEHDTKFRVNPALINEISVSKNEVFITYKNDKIINVLIH